MNCEKKDRKERTMGTILGIGLDQSPREEFAGQMAAMEPPAVAQIFGGDVSSMDGRASNRAIFSSLPIENVRSLGRSSRSQVLFFICFLDLSHMKFFYIGGREAV